VAFVRFLLALAVAGVAHFVGTKLVGVFPQALDLFLLVAVLKARDGKPVAGMIAGAACGLAADGLSGAPYGLHGFADTAVAYAVAAVAQRLAVQRTSGLLLVFTLAGALQQVLLAALTLLFLPGAELPSPTWMAVKAVGIGILGLGWTRLARATAQSRLARRARQSERMRF